MVREGLQESLVQILSPQRRVDLLRDCMEAKSRGRPYSITFCGVNGVGKSTNLAKVSYAVYLVKMSLVQNLLNVVLTYYMNVWKHRLVI